MPKAMRMVAVGFTLALFLTTCSSQKNSEETTDSVADTASVFARIELVGRDSVSVFELLQESHEVDYQESSMGVFVTGIDSVQAEDGAYWLYSINDTIAQVGCDQAVTRTGDQIVWELTKP